MKLTQKDLDYFNDARNYKRHICNQMGCGCPANGSRWREYDEWVRLGRPYTMEEVVSEKYIKIVKKENKNKKFYILLFVLFFMIFMLYIVIKI